MYNENGLFQISLKELENLKTIHEGHTDDKLIQTPDYQVWMSRMTVEDEALCDNEVTVEILVDGLWKTVQRYEPSNRRAKAPLPLEEGDLFEFDLEHLQSLKFLRDAPAESLLIETETYRIWFRTVESRETWAAAFAEEGQEPCDNLVTVQIFFAGKWETVQTYEALSRYDEPELDEDKIWD